MASARDQENFLNQLMANMGVITTLETEKVSSLVQFKKYYYLNYYYYYYYYYYYCFCYCIIVIILEPASE